MQRVQLLQPGIQCNWQAKLVKPVSRSSPNGWSCQVIGKALVKRAVQQRSRKAVWAVATAEATRQPSVEGSRLDGKLKIIGLGARGISAIKQLVRHGGVGGPEIWCLDVDRNNLDVPSANIHALETDGDGQCKGMLSEAVLGRIVGEGARDRGGKGNANVGDGGVAFVLSSATNVPGGTDLVLQLVGELRAAGIFTVAAVTRPFTFEGPRKLEAADHLVASLRQCAHLVAVIEQEVLAGVRTGIAGTPMTMADATRFADNALEHMVRTLGAALAAPQILESTQGALRWDGLQYERRYRRLLSPPLQRLLTQPGIAALGRGGAAMPAHHAGGMGPKEALMQLSSEAVRVAAQSPFLENAVGRARAVLCCLYLPSIMQRGAGEASEAHAARMAVQAAAGALSLACPCDNIVMCAVPASAVALSQDGHGPGTVEVQASLLVLHDPDAPSIALPVQTPSAAPAPRKPPARPPPREQKLPASTWTAMSALAGGTARRVPPSPVPPRPAEKEASRGQPRRESAPVPAQQLRQESEQGERVTVGDFLVDSLTAQSLDLPPQAAKWRQQQRIAAGGERPRVIIRETGAAGAAGPDGDEGDATEGGPLDAALRTLLGMPPQRGMVDARERTSGILERDRGELWDAPD
ncbi:probable cell division protein FtsZ 2 at N-terminal half [Coccomyxa sp. Obi]|nr:probable cell division protein FtsZ 2 at N-terminal half [Coccomyxa sp. Obi]